MALGIAATLGVRSSRPALGIGATLGGVGRGLLLASGIGSLRGDLLASRGLGLLRDPLLKAGGIGLLGSDLLLATHIGRALISNLPLLGAPIGLGALALLLLGAPIGLGALALFLLGESPLLRSDLLLPAVVDFRLGVHGHLATRRRHV